jgi:hypothetical protein
MDLSNSDAVVLFSPVSVAELWAGARPNEHNALNNLFRALTCAPIDKEAGDQAGAWLRNPALRFDMNSLPDRDREG